MKAITTKPADLLHGSGSYSDMASYATAEHAVAVYAEPWQYTASCLEQGFTGATIVSVGAAQVGVAWHDDVILVTARGSSEKADWFGDLASVFRRGWPGVLPKGARMGLGWRRQCVNVCGDVLRFVARLLERRPGAKVVITGHSLGGAMAVGILCYFREHGIPVQSCYAHEPPRPGNQKLKEWVATGNTPVYTVVNIEDGERDLVTRVPLKRNGARHVGEMTMNAHGDVYRGEAAWEAHRASNPVGYAAGWRVITKLIRAARAHSGKALLKALRRRALLG